MTKKWNVLLQDILQVSLKNKPPRKQIRPPGKNKNSVSGEGNANATVEKMDTGEEPVNDRVEKMDVAS